MRKGFAAILLALAMILVPALPASAHTAQLGFCSSSTSYRLHLPGIRDLGASSNWSAMGFRTCQVASSDSHTGPRGTIWVRCFGGNGIDPIMNILNDTTGERQSWSFTCNGNWHSRTSSTGGWPGGTNSHTYHAHWHLEDVYYWYDAQFTDADMRWNIAP